MPQPLARQRWELIAFLVIVFAAFLTRLTPIAISSYPFNNDGITESSIAQRIIDSGKLVDFSLNVDGTTHSSAFPAMNVFLAYVSSLMGVSPFIVAQAVIAVISMGTVAGLFVIGRSFSGDVRGGVTAGTMAVLMGTFVFTSGSVWKEAFGIGLLILLVLSFIRRNELRFRAMCYAVLLMMPLVHHLVTVVALLLVAYPVVWSWFYAIRHKALKWRHFQDISLVLIPASWTFVVYSLVSLDRLQTFSTSTSLLFISVAFACMCTVMILALSLKSHSKRSFAVFPGLALSVLLILDYSGLLFPYRPSASTVYIFLVLAFGVMISIAWFGTEYALEHRQRFRAIHVALLLSPATLIGFGLMDGLTSSSQQVLYRTFDFVDIFIFMGAALAIAALVRTRNKILPFVTTALMIAVVVSFPFGYESNSLLGVRHDTQAYEVDAVEWLDHAQTRPQLFSDERLSYIAQAIAGIPKDNTLSKFFSLNYTEPPNWYGAVEFSYLTTGLNNYPNGLTVIPLANFTRMMDASNVLYIGGPTGQGIMIFSTSNYGHDVILGPILP